MGIENLKRWHWVLIGLLVGLALAYAQIGLGTDNLVAGGKHSSIGQETFERALEEPPVRGHPIVEDLRVYPDGSKFLVKLRYLGRDPSDPKNGKLRKYEESVLTTNVPFCPLRNSGKTIDVKILPAFSERVKMNASVVTINSGRKATDVSFAGWAGGDLMSADPGSGADIKLQLNPTAYLLKVNAPDVSATAMTQLAISMNGKPLAPLVAMPDQPHDAGIAIQTKGMWQTQIPATLLSSGYQTLHLARGTEPMRIHELRLINPTYTVVDYLKDQQIKNKQLTFRYAWWTQTRATLAVWTLGSAVIVGGIWPTVIQLLIGAGFGSPPQNKPSYDLSRFKSERNAATRKSPGVSQEDVDRLAAQTAELESKLKATASAAAPAAAPVAAPSALRTLNAAPIESLLTVEDPNALLEFKEGEYYPVVRKPLERKPGTPDPSKDRDENL